MVLLGLPSFGLTFGVTILTAFLPALLHKFVDPSLIGIIIGAEGLFGLFVPLIFGVLADRAKTVGGRWEYLLPATAAMAVSLVLMGVFNNIWIMATMVAIFYIGYFAYLAPYWATYPDLVPKEHSGRSRSAESTWRVVGAFTALISGGFLLTLWRPLPFVLAAGLVALVTFIFGFLIRAHYKTKIHTHHESVKDSARSAYQIIKRDSDMRNLLIANALWNATLQSIQAFTVLFFTEGIGRSAHFVSGVIFPVAAIGIFAMAPIAGKLADRVGHLPVLKVACLVYGVGNLVPAFTHSSWVILIIPIVGAAAVTIMTLPYSALMHLIGDGRHGAISGLFGVSRGIGTFLGPIVAGAAISLGRPLFESTNGYGAFWLVSGIFILVSMFFLVQIKHKDLHGA